MVAQRNASIIRAFAILKLFTEQRSEISAAEVAREFCMNTVTAHRFLKTLEEVGALVSASKGVYRLGYVFADLGDRVIQADSLGRTLQPILNEITREVEEASMAAIFRADMVVCIAQASTNRQLSVDIRVGSRLDAYCTAHGKTWLAYMPQHQRERYFQVVERKRLTDHTIVDRETLLRQLQQIRSVGHAFNYNEREEGIRAVAVPVLTHNGRIIASLSVFGPASRLSDDFLEKSLARLREAADEAQFLLYGKVEGAVVRS